jgi:hypothetical protein
VRALTAEELQHLLDAHAGQPVQRLGSGWAALDPSVHPPGGPWTAEAAEPACPEPHPPVPTQPVTGSPGRSALAKYRRRRAAELAAWTRSLVWRALLVAAGLVAGAVVAQAGVPGPGLVGLATAALMGWRLRFRPSERARAWQRGAAGERQTARLLDRLGRDGYVVFHDLAMPDLLANLDCDDPQRGVRHRLQAVDRTRPSERRRVGLAQPLPPGPHPGHPPLASRDPRSPAGRPRSPRWSASMAPTSSTAGCAPTAWRSSPPACSAAPSAMTRCCRTPTSSYSPRRPGQACALPPEPQARVDDLRCGPSWPSRCWPATARGASRCTRYGWVPSCWRCSASPPRAPVRSRS